MASWPAATERLRPMVIGRTMPGKRTRLRTGRMMSASAGNGGIFDFVSFVIVSVQTPQMNGEATMRHLAALQFEQPARQFELALEAAVRNLEAPNRRAAHFFRPRPTAPDTKLAALDHYIDVIRGDAGQRDQECQAILGLEEIDRRLPKWAARRPGSLEKLPTQPFGPIEQLERFGPHEATKGHSGSTWVSSPRSYAGPRRQYQPRRSPIACLYNERGYNPAFTPTTHLGGIHVARHTRARSARSRSGASGASRSGTRAMDRHLHGLARHPRCARWLPRRDDARSEERRVGKECRSRWSP